MFTAPVTQDGKILNPETLPKTVSTAREYESIRVRFWNSYSKPYHSTLWYTTLVKDEHTWKYTLREKPPGNALQGTDIAFPWAEDPFSGGSYEIGKLGILVNTVDPTYNPAERIKSEVFYIPLKTFNEPSAKVIPLTRDLKGWTGSATAATFSRDGNVVVLLKHKDWKRDWANPSIFVIFVVDNPLGYKQCEVTVTDAETKKPWDCSPSSLIFSEVCGHLYAVAEHRGRNCLFRIVAKPDATDDPFCGVANNIAISSGSVASIHHLPSSEPQSVSSIFVNTTSLVDSSIYQKVSIGLEANSSVDIFSSATNNGADLGLHCSQVKSFTFPGAGKYNVHAYLLLPSFFCPSKKYPIALWPHGGPTMSYTDSWSPRWNSMALAEQGYIVILPNITGSTGYGEEFCEAVSGDWGGRPYQDLVKCWEYVERELEFVDMERAVCLGASYSGYMVNWIAGQPFAKKFRAFVCHDGIFDNLNLVSGDVASSTRFDMGGQIFSPHSSVLKSWDKHSPSRYTANWTQPMLIIHSDNDYRCPITEGLAAFNVCQMKGIESRFLNFPDECHFVEGKANRLHWYRTVFRWCNKFSVAPDGIRLEPPVSEPWRGQLGREKR